MQCLIGPNRFRGVWLVVLACLFTGCAQQSSFQMKDLAKSDVDLVADLHRSATLELLQELNTKLYRRNPVQLGKVPAESIESRWQGILNLPPGVEGIEELGGVRSIEAMRLAFSDDFGGDRVFALMVGLSGMLDEAYGFKREFFILDSIDGQKLYNSARNIEVMVWLLRTKKDDEGRPLIFSDSMSEGAINLSFERLFGKLIAHQDMMSRIMAGKTQRAVNTVAHGLVSMTFVPL